MNLLSFPEDRFAVNSGPTTTDPIANDSSTTIHFKTVQCRQDTVGASYFEVIASLIGSVIVVINLIAIVAILFRDRSGPNRHKHKVIFQCICNLAVADLLTGLFLLWIFCLQEVVLPLRTAQTELAQKSVWTVTIWSSMLSQNVIAVYCCHRATRKKKGEDGPKWLRFIKIGIALTWLIPIITFVLPVVTIWNCAKDCVCQMPSNSSTGVYYMVCSPVESCSQINPPFTKGSMLFLGLTLILMPSIPFVLYAKIYHFKRNFTRRRHLSHPSPNSVQRDDEQDKKLLLTLIIILGVLLVCTVPLGVLFLISFQETDKRYVEVTKVLLTISLLNSLINPVIYFWRFKEMRKSVQKWFTACRRSDRSINLDTSAARETLNRFMPMGFRRGESLVENEPAPATAAASDLL